MEDFYSIKEVSKLNDISEKTIRRIISDILETRDEPLLVKNKRSYLIHKDLLNSFITKRKKKTPKEPKFYALSVNILGNHSKSDIDKIMPFLFESLNGDSDLVLKYLITSAGYGKHRKVENTLYIYTNYTNFNLLINTLRLLFFEIRYTKKEIYDLKKWLTYITRGGDEITILKRDGEYFTRKKIEDVFNGI